MAKKSNNFSEESLKAMGMIEISPGVFKKSEHGSPKAILTDKGFVNVQDFNGRDKMKAGPIIDTLSVKNNEQFKANPISEWFIPYQVPSKKNCQKLYVRSDGTPGTTVSDRMKDYKNITKMYWMIFGKEFKKAIDHYQLKFPLKVEFTFIRSTNQHFDYLGPAETVQDFMGDKDFNWIPGDDVKHIKPSFGDYEVNKQNPGVRIKLLIQ